MSNIKVSGIAGKAFLARTHKALEAFTGSPIKSLAKVRQFLTDQLDQPNEHTLKSVFEEPEKNNRVHLLTVLHFDFNEHGTGLALNADNITNTLYESREALDQGLIDAFCSAFPDHDGVTSDLFDLRIVNQRIEEVARERDVDESVVVDELEQMTASEAQEWLIDNFSPKDLAYNIIEPITNGLCQIQHESLEVHRAAVQEQSVEAPTTARLLEELQQCVREAIDNNRWVVDGRNDPDALLDPVPNDRAQGVLVALARSARAAIENSEWSFDTLNKQSAFLKKIERYLETGQSRSSDGPEYALEL